LGITPDGEWRSVSECPICPEPSGAADVADCAGGVWKKDKP
jgi:hypothetical protein